MPRSTATIYTTTIVALALLGCTARGVEEPDVRPDEEPTARQTDPPTPEPEPPAPAPPSGVHGLAAGVHHTCALRDGRAWCWGLNRWGMLGVGADAPTRQHQRDAVVRPSPVLGFDEDDPPEQLGLGYDFSCARTRAGAVYCWGDNDSAQLGTGDEIRRDRPTRVAGLGPVAAIHVDYQGVCATTVERGETFCWGTGDFGDAARRHHQATPVSIATFARIDHLARNCLLRRGEVRCWGDNGSGQIGNGEGGCERDEPPCPHSRCLPPTTCKQVDKPTAPIGLPEILELDSSGTLVYARDADGRVWQWGQIGHTMSYEPRDNYKPQPRAELPAMVEISAGSNHACARTEAGELWCWGNDSFGQLGYPLAGQDSRQPPGIVEGLPPVRAIAAGFYYTCALASADTAAPLEIWCWGDNGWGQLGDGTADRRQAPVAARW